MNAEQIREYCIDKKGVTEEFPFGNDTLVFKVSGKMFALLSLEGELSINLKCDPEKAIESREQFPFVKPGYHMNKKHWNSIYVDQSHSEPLLYEWIDHSYNLVVKNLPKKMREQISG